MSETRRIRVRTPSRSYDVLVGRARTFLFHEDPRWFVEEIVFEGDGTW